MAASVVGMTAHPLCAAARATPRQQRRRSGVASMPMPAMRRGVPKTASRNNGVEGGEEGGGEGEKMHVPEDAFKDGDGKSVTPERKAATALTNLFTMAAVRVILDQFTGTRHRSPVYNKMVDFLSVNPLRNGNEWLAKLMRDPDTDLRVTAMRIIETRRIYATSEFNWEIMERVAVEGIKEDTLEMSRAYLTSLASLKSVGEEEEG
eukprot:CAMPEP_0197592172 /NCGR_PEP_ID=MMETSP1326-20131121/14860_1 /TAXON_ID=1155430 /ORGANISM="Genus nov. species nov., Strain RCC2288" /LENGTH=205 /DNA_ID=CAMNT_0043157837 /DNA_START=49 /DNA_END=662 /DNA_ORIENTATION=+